MGKQYLNGVLYGTGEIIKFSPYIYSLEEREVGVWTDGKPLYQKSFLIPASTTTGDNTFTTPLGLQNVDKVIDYNVILITGSGSFLRLPLSLDTKSITIQNEYSFNLQSYDKTTDILRIDIGSLASYQGGYGTIQYTKTTDTPGSGYYTTKGGEAHHYSTSEQIVGTWINGKPLYEKTYLINDSSSNVSNNILSSLNISLLIEGKWILWDDNVMKTYYIGYNTQTKNITDHPSGWTHALIVKYTKTTD